MTPPMTPRDSKLQKVQNALASGSGDHAELERVRAVRATCESRMKGYEVPIHAADVVFALDFLDRILAENAALRARENDLIAGHAVAVAALERKLAEAERLNDRAADLMRQCTDPERFVGASTLNVYANMRAWLSALSKEAERG